MQTIAIFDTIHFGLRKRRPIFQADFINIHVTKACTLVKRVNFELNSFVNHTTPLCLQNMHMLYLRNCIKVQFWFLSNSFKLDYHVQQYYIVDQEVLHKT